MNAIYLLPAFLLSLPMSAVAQDQSAIDRVIGGRLLVSEFIRICVRTDAEPVSIEGIALDETWIPDAPSSIKAGLNRVPSSAATIYSFSRSRSTSAGRVRTQMQVIVPEPDVRDCTLEFEQVAFTDARQALVSSGYTEEKDDPNIPAEAPARVQRTKLCEASKPRRTPNCVELAIDPASYPLTGQLTLVRVGPEMPDQRGEEDETSSAD